MTPLENALSVCNLVRKEFRDTEFYDIIPIVYAIKNRLSRGESLDQVVRELKSPKLGDYSFSGGGQSGEPCLTSLSIVAGVFAGLYDDPTNGATRFHRHDHTPAWADGLQCTALLGPYIYYRA